jgi:hypothetical protein
VQRRRHSTKESSSARLEFPLISVLLLRQAIRTRTRRSITIVTAGTDLTGGGTTGNVTLSLDTTKVPLLTTSNAFVGN